MSFASNWGKSNQSTGSTWGAASNSTANKTTTTQAGWGSRSGQGTRNNAEPTSSAPLVAVPRSTLTMSVRDFHREQILSYEGQEQQKWQLDHVLAVDDLFSGYTVAELRYFDYLAMGRVELATSNTTGGFASTGTKLGFGTSGFGATTATPTSFGSSVNKEVEIIIPWQVEPEPVEAPPKPQEDYPYNVFQLPAFQIAEDNEDTGKEAPRLEVPRDSGFSKKESLSSKLGQQKKSATPGLVGSLVASRIALTSSRHVAANDSLFNHHSTADDEEISARAEAEVTFVPPLEDIREGDRVENFEVVHKDGVVMFPMPLAPGKIHFDKVVQFKHGQVDVTINKLQRNALGITDKFPSLVKLNNIWPNDEQTTDAEALGQYSKTLELWCSDHGLRFVSYIPVTGEFRFSVPRLSQFPVAPPV